MKPNVTVTTDDLDRLNQLTFRMNQRSMWYAVTPLPDGWYEIEFKHEHKEAIDAINHDEFTVFCQEATGGGTIWIQDVVATDPDHAREVGRQTCADDWGYDPEDVHVLGVAIAHTHVVLWHDLCE